MLHLMTFGLSKYIDLEISLKELNYTLFIRKHGCLNKHYLKDIPEQLF